MTRLTASMIAAFLALPLGAQAAPSSEHGRQLAKTCAGCHGMDGNSTDPARYPNLAAQAPAYLALQLANFKSGERPDPVMKAIAAALTTTDIRDLAVYFGARTAKPQPSSNRDLEEQGRRLFTGSCAACHGANGHGQGTAPRVASQPASYTHAQLRVYKSAPSFRNPLAMVMKGVAVKLSEDDMAALAAYLATVP
jgi:cytochrome c553